MRSGIDHKKCRMFAPKKPCFYDCLSQLKTQLLQKYIVLCALCTNTMLHICMFLLSPSPRRAWIEICFGISLFRVSLCRPPHGGRGLKSIRELVQKDGKTESPSPRRAWIEIPPYLSQLSRPEAGRPPHGGRGLKLNRLTSFLTDIIVALPTEGVD